MKRRYCVLAWLIFASLCSNAFAGEYIDVTPGYSLEFPRDLYYRKDFRVQWWYFTGHLLDANGREFGYELTFFVVGVQKRKYRSQFGVNNIYLSHFAVLDLKERKYYFAESADSGAFGLSGAKGNELRVWVGDSLLEGSMERMHLKASDRDKTIDLTLVPQKPFVLNGEGGYSRKSEESPLFASLYFSCSQVKTTGTVKIGEGLFTVNGKSWFDRELSTKGLSESEQGWDWFSIQLDDGREIMLYLLRKNDGSVDRFSSGTFVYGNGRYRHLTPDDFSVTVLDHYRSKKTNAKYPSQWEIGIPSEKVTLRVSSLLEDQEFLATHSTGNYYWEGSCKVEGSATGRAYVEMTGY